MDHSPSTPPPALLFTAHQMRGMIRAARGGYAPDHVARTLRDRVIIISYNESKEIAALLTGLIETADARLRDAGIAPLDAGAETAQGLTHREREYVENIALLFALRSQTECTLGEWQQGLASAQEGLAWSRAAGSPTMEMRLHHAVAECWHIPGEFDREEEARRLALEAARRSGRTMLIIEAIAYLASYLVAHMRLEEGTAVNDEGFALLQEEPIERRGWLYPSFLLNRGRLECHHTRYAEGLRTMREALRWSDAETHPDMRASVLSILGGIYLQLEEFQESIRTLHEMVELADRTGLERGRGWGYFGLAEAYTLLKDLESAGEMLDRIGTVPEGDPLLVLSVDHKRAELLARSGRTEEAIALAETVVERIGERELPDQLMVTCRMLSDLEKRRGDYAKAERWCRRAIAVCDASFPKRTPALNVSLADILLRLDRDDEASVVLDTVTSPRSLIGNIRHRALHLRARIAERRGDMRAALDCEREAFTIERETLARKKEEGMRNARIVAEIGLLEREADIERENRSRVEHELAEAVVALGERKRMIEEVEERIAAALAETRGDASLTATLRGVLGELRTQSNGTDSPLRYMSGVDQEFYARLRKRWPDLTPKQERLCGLIRAGLGSKEISTLLELGPEGLKAQRKRLRKRLELGVDEKLETVLAEV